MASINQTAPAPKASQSSEAKQEVMQGAVQDAANKSSVTANSKNTASKDTPKGSSNAPAQPVVVSENQKSAKSMALKSTAPLGFQSIVPSVSQGRFDDRPFVVPTRQAINPETFVNHGDNNGSLANSELRDALSGLGANIDMDKVNALMRNFDSQRDGVVDAKEVANMLHMGALRDNLFGVSVDLGKVDAVAFVASGDNNGSLANWELQGALKERGLDLPMDQVNALGARYNANGDGVIDAFEAQKMMLGGALAFRADGSVVVNGVINPAVQDGVKQNAAVHLETVVPPNSDTERWRISVETKDGWKSFEPDSSGRIDVTVLASDAPANGLDFGAYGTKVRLERAYIEPFGQSGWENQSFTWTPVRAENDAVNNWSSFYAKQFNGTNVIVRAYGIDKPVLSGPGGAGTYQGVPQIHDTPRPSLVLGKSIASVAPANTVLGQALQSDLTAQAVNGWVPNWAKKFVDKVVSAVGNDVDAVKKYFSGGVEALKNDWEALKKVGAAVEDILKAGKEGFEGLAAEVVGGITGLPGLGDFGKQLLDQAKNDLGKAEQEGTLGLVMLALQQTPDQAKETIGKFALTQDLFALGGADAAKKAQAEERLKPMLDGMKAQFEAVKKTNKQPDGAGLKVDAGFDLSGSARLGAKGYGLSVEQLRIGGVFRLTNEGWSKGIVLKWYDQVGAALPSGPATGDISLMGSRDVTFSWDANNKFSVKHTSSLSVFGEGSFDSGKVDQAVLNAIASGAKTVSNGLANLLRPLEASTSADIAEAATGAEVRIELAAQRIGETVASFGDIEQSFRAQGLDFNMGDPSHKLEFGGLGGMYIRRDLTNTSFGDFIGYVLAPEMVGGLVGGAGGAVAGAALTYFTEGKAAPYFPAFVQAGSDLGVFGVDVAMGLFDPDHNYPKHEFGFSTAFWVDRLDRDNVSGGGLTVGAGSRLQAAYGWEYPITSTMRSPASGSNSAFLVA